MVEELCQIATRRFVPEVAKGLVLQLLWWREGHEKVDHGESISTFSTR